MHDADVFLTWKFTAEMEREGKELKWIHLSGAGVEHVLTPGVRESEILVTNTRGIHGPFMAEWTVAALFYLTQQWSSVEAWRHDRDWKRHKDGIQRKRVLLRGQSALVVGGGAVGGEIARTLGALGAECAVVHRGGRTIRGKRYPVDKLAEIIGGFGIVVIALPSTAETRGMFDAELIGRMQRESLLVNVARGSIVDQNALIAALQSGHLAGAAIDVFPEEPLPPDSLLFDAPNLFMSPHVSGNYPDYTRDVIEVFLKNLRRYAKGKPLLYVVNKQLGY